MQTPISPSIDFLAPAAAQGQQTMAADKPVTSFQEHLVKKADLHQQNKTTDEVPSSSLPTNKNVEHNPASSGEQEHFSQPADDQQAETFLPQNRGEENILPPVQKDVLAQEIISDKNSLPSGQRNETELTNSQPQETRHDKRHDNAPLRPQADGQFFSEKMSLRHDPGSEKVPFQDVPGNSQDTVQKNVSFQPHTNRQEILENNIINKGQPLASAHQQAPGQEGAKQNVSLTGSQDNIFPRMNPTEPAVPAKGPFSNQPYVITTPANSGISEFNIGQIETGTALEKTAASTQQWVAARAQQQQPVPQQQMQPAQHPPVIDNNQAGQTPFALKGEQEQTVTVYQAGETETMTASVASNSSISRADQRFNRQDFRSNYIQSQLPSNAPNSAGHSAGEAQQHLSDGNQQGQQNNSDAPLAQEAFTLTETGSSKTAAVLSAIINNSADNSSSATMNNAPVQSTAPSYIRLPSGITVPDTMVMEQVINHISNSQKLESSSMHLRLHPQELGELRMQIEVKQDNIKAHIITQNPQAQDALERHLPKLKETLEQQGLNLSDVEITVEAGDEYDGQRYKENMERQQLAKNFRPAHQNSRQIFPNEEETIVTTSSDQGLSIVA